MCVGFTLGVSAEVSPQHATKITWKQNALQKNRHVGTGASIHLYGQKNWLVVDHQQPTPLKNDGVKVSWDYEHSQYMEK